MTNSNEIKVTRVEAMNICRELVSGTDRADKEKIIEVIDKMIESLSKKSVSKADKAKIEENESFRHYKGCKWEPWNWLYL